MGAGGDCEGQRQSRDEVRRERAGTCVPAHTRAVAALWPGLVAVIAPRAGLPIVMIGCDSHGHGRSASTCLPIVRPKPARAGAAWPQAGAALSGMRLHHQHHAAGGKARGAATADSTADLGCPLSAARDDADRSAEMIAANQNARRSSGVLTLRRVAAWCASISTIAAGRTSISFQTDRSPELSNC